MTYLINKKDVQSEPHEGHTTYPMLDERHGCVAGFKSGISVYTALEYRLPACMKTRKVLSCWKARDRQKVGDEECRLEPEMCFIAPAGVLHCIKRDPDSESVALKKQKCAVLRFAR